MQLRTTKLTAGLILAFGGLTALGVQAQQRVEITGSAIKRSNAATPAPIEIITRTEISRTGATSINELIKNISVIDINDQGEQSSNSPGGSGTSRIRMRGLGESQVLVLLNGRRVPKNPLADATGAGSAFNLNSIPVAAIERIEILKDGGSAIYGADAIAGVVNFILRKDFSSTIANLTFGQSSRSDGAETAFNAVAGYGDLDQNGFNVMGAIDVFKRDPILRKDRDLSRSVDFRRFGPIPGYNLDGRSVFAPQGNYLTPAGALAGQTVTPCPPESQSGAFCVYDFNASLLTSYNGADRISGLLNAQIQLGKSHSAYARWVGSKNEDNFEAHPVPDFFVSPAGAPFPQYAGRFMQGGPRITDKTTDFSHFDLGVEGTFGTLDYKVGLSSGTSKSTNRDKNYYNRTLWNAATQSGAINATSLTNPAAAVEALKVTPVRTGKETLDQFDAQVSSSLFKLPAGDLKYAVGASVWSEKIQDTPDPLQVDNLVVGSIAQSLVNTKRDAWAIFAELQIPVTQTIEAQLAVRRDDYDTAAATSPKFAVKWQALPNLALRTSYTESFKMPTLKQQFASAGQGAITLTPGQCQLAGNSAAECANGLPAFRRTGSNPDLGPESGKTLNFGVIGDFGPLSMSVDYWDIKKTNNITTPTIQAALENGLFQRDAQNRVIVFLNLQNIAESRNTGIDVDARLRFPGLPVVGDLTIRGSGTYYLHQDLRTTSSSPWQIYGNTYSTPLWSSRLTMTSVKGPWTTQGTMRTTGGFWDTAQPLNFIVPTTPGGNRKVGTYQEVDLTVSYEGIKNLKLTGGIKNLFDQMPPFSAQNAASNNYSQMGFSEQYNVRGRFFQIGAEYRF